MVARLHGLTVDAPGATIMPDRSQLRTTIPGRHVQKPKTMENFKVVAHWRYVLASDANKSGLSHTRRIADKKKRLSNERSLATSTCLLSAANQAPASIIRRDRELKRLNEEIKTGSRRFCRRPWG